MSKNILIVVVLTVVLLLGGYFLFNNNTDQNNMKSSDQSKSGDKLPFKMIDDSKQYKAVMETTAGTITLELNAKMTPITVSNFVSLANKGFYKDVIFHRVIKGFMIQGGDPTGTGSGDPGYKFDDEPFEGEYTRGTLAMANAGPDTNGSQFFIMHKDNPLPPDYTIFGRVIEGMEVVDKIAEAPVSGPENSTPVTLVKIKSVKIIN